MSISEQEKREIMEKLAQGKPGLTNHEPPKPEQQNFDPVSYQNFDDFAQRSTGERTTSSTYLDSTTLKQIKEQITTDLNQAKETGQLRADRIKEIVQSAVAQVAKEFKSGSSEIRSIVRDAVSAVSDSLQGKSGEIKEEITASIEGVIEGIFSGRRESIAKNQAEVKHLQTKIDAEEEELEKELNTLLNEIEEDGTNRTPDTKAAIASAINALKNSEEIALMKKRYAQIQAQAAILKANLAARYGGRYEEIKEHLEEARAWYDKTRTQAETVVEQAEQKRSHIEERLREAREALTKKERQIRQLLSELLKAAAELVREKEQTNK